MLWNNLKSGKCPIEGCDGLLKQVNKNVECEIDDCRFFMKLQKYNEVIKPKEENKKYQKAIKRRKSNAILAKKNKAVLKNKDFTKIAVSIEL